MITKMFEADNHSRDANIIKPASIEHIELVKYICKTKYSIELDQFQS